MLIDIWHLYLDIVAASGGHWFFHMIRCGLIIYIMAALLRFAEKYRFQEETQTEEDGVTRTYTIPRGRAFAVITSLIIGILIPYEIEYHLSYDLMAKIFLFFIPAFIFGPVYISRRLTGVYNYRKVLYVLVYALIFFSYLLTD